LQSSRSLLSGSGFGSDPLHCTGLSASYPSRAEGHYPSAPITLSIRNEERTSMSATRFQIATGLASVLVGGVLALSLAGAADSPVPLSRYRFQVGQELLYSGSSEFRYEGGQSAEKSTWRVWVVRQNKEGGWRLVIRHGRIYSRIEGDGKVQTTTEIVHFF